MPLKSWMSRVADFFTSIPLEGVDLSAKKRQEICIGDEDTTRRVYLTKQTKR